MLNNKSLEIRCSELSLQYQQKTMIPAIIASDVEIILLTNAG